MQTNLLKTEDEARALAADLGQKLKRLKRQPNAIKGLMALTLMDNAGSKPIHTDTLRAAGYREDDIERYGGHAIAIAMNIMMAEAAMRAGANLVHEGGRA